MNDELPGSFLEGLPPTGLRRVKGLGSVLMAAGGLALIALVVGTFAWAAHSPADRGAARTGPLIGDHWHAIYAIYVGDQRQPNIPTWESGVHTHGDGIIHIHPFQAFEEGKGAALSKFFDYGGGLLADDAVRIPGTSRTFQNGDQIPGEAASGQVLIAARSAIGPERMGELGNGWYQVSPDYIPYDGDQIIIFFSTEQEVADLLERNGSVPTLTPVPSPPATVTL